MQAGWIKSAVVYAYNSELIPSSFFYHIVEGYNMCTNVKLLGGCLWPLTTEKACWRLLGVVVIGLVNGLEVWGHGNLNWLPKKDLSGFGLKASLFRFGVLKFFDPFVCHEGDILLWILLQYHQKFDAVRVLISTLQRNYTISIVKIEVQGIECFPY